MGGLLVSLRSDCDCLSPEAAERLCRFAGTLHVCPAASVEAWMNQAAGALSELMPPNFSCWMMDAGIDGKTGRWAVHGFGTSLAAGSRERAAVSEQLQSGFPADDARGAGVRAFGVPVESSLSRREMYDDAEWRASAYRAVCERAGVHDFVRSVRALREVPERRWLVAEARSMDPDRPCAPELPALMGSLTDAMARAYEHRFLRLERVRAELLGRISAAAHPVLPLLAEGYSEAEIGKRVYRSVHTVHDHVKQIYKALGIASRIELRDLWMGNAEVRSRV